MIVGLLSFFDEPLAALALCVEGIANAGVGHLVALDGAYSLYPDGKAASHPDQHAVLHGACRTFGIGSTIHVPRDVWHGNETEKRTALFALGWVVAQPGDWFWIVDGDEIVVEVPDDLPERLAATDRDAANVRISDKSTGDDFAGRRLYRAQAIRVVGNHYTYVADDGRVLFEGNGSAREVPALSLTSVVTVEHRPGMRSEARQWAKSDYYDARDAQGVERGQCARCDLPAVTRMPIRWRFPTGKPPESDIAELCARHAEWADRENARRLVAHGFDPARFRWREKYTPLMAVR